jgi:hypothetical protein
MVDRQVPAPNLPPLPETPSPLIVVRPPKLPPLPQNPVQAMIPNGGMPKLPALPWIAKRHPSFHVVQKQYVQTRQEELEAQKMPAKYQALGILRDMLSAKLPVNGKQQEIPFSELTRVYEAMERNLQAADLTVNFKCDTWFTNPNPYDTYTQMYQRALEGGTMVLRNTDVNDADTRANADNAITFPPNWGGGPRQQPARGLGPGLRPGRQAPDRIQRQMDTGTLVPIHQQGELPAFLAGNRHFNPDTKQVFLALNYGRRPHGSAVNYGCSHFVVKGKLKSKCLYYAQDTFLRAGQGANAGIQVSYAHLGTILEANGDRGLRDDIFASCYQGKILEDVVKTLAKYYLVEAHHFGDLSFSKDVEYMIISPMLPDMVTRIDRNLWPVIVENAKEFCRRNNIGLFQTD